MMGLSNSADELQGLEWIKGMRRLGTKSVRRENPHLAAREIVVEDYQTTFEQTQQIMFLKDPLY
jgi:hypothetical protein